MARQFSLAYLTLPGVDPVEQIKIAKDAGYDYVSLRTIPMGQPGEPRACLELYPDLNQQVKQALKDTGMKVLDIELVRVREDLPADHRAAFEKGAELGAKEVLSSIWTPDRSFAIDRMGAYCEQAAEFGLTMNLEFPVIAGVTNLADTMAVQEAVGASNLKILIDMLYINWDGTPPAELAKIDPERFGVIHMCDCPKPGHGLETTQIMREGRAYVGEGCVDIAGILKALPERPMPIELPNAKRIAELGRLGHAKRCLETARAYCAANGLV